MHVVDVIDSIKMIRMKASEMLIWSHPTSYPFKNSQEIVDACNRLIQTLEEGEE